MRIGISPIGGKIDDRRFLNDNQTCFSVSQKSPEFGILEHNRAALLGKSRCMSGAMEVDSSNMLEPW